MNRKVLRRRRRPAVKRRDRLLRQRRRGSTRCSTRTSTPPARRSPRLGERLLLSPPASARRLRRRSKICCSGCSPATRSSCSSAPWPVSASSAGGFAPPPYSGRSPRRLRPPRSGDFPAPDGRRRFDRRQFCRRLDRALGAWLPRALLAGRHGRPSRAFWRPVLPPAAPVTRRRSRGTQRLFAAFADARLDETLELAEPWRITEVICKPYPCSGGKIGAIDSAQRSETRVSIPAPSIMSASGCPWNQRAIAVS